MIHVDRSTVPVPQSLTSGRAAHEVAKVASLLEKRDLREQVRIEFKTEIYTSVRSNLVSLFNGKCAYCESEVASTQAADIEHFRPKQGASDLEGKKREHLYYAWLAYDWDNLLLACVACGRRRRTPDGRIVGKGDRFPVEGERAPLMSPIAQCRAIEHALLLDPCFDEPAEHLRFEDDGMCAPLSNRGSATLALLDLNREELVVARKRTAQSVNVLARDWIRLTLDGEGKAQSTLDDLKELVSGRLPYTAAARNAFAHLLDDLQRGTPGRSAQSVAPNANPQQVADAAATLQSAVSQQWFPKQYVTAEQASNVAPEIEQAATSAPDKYEGRATLPPYAQARLIRISLRNFKAIETLELEVPLRAADSNEAAGALMLLGENATGKSTVLEAVALALLGTKQVGKLGLDPGSYVRRTVDWTTQAASAEPPRVELWFEGMTAPRTLEIRKERFEGDPDPATVLLGYGPRRFFQPSGRNLLRSVFNWGTAPFERVRTLFDPVATITNPADWLAKLEPGQFNAIVRALKKLLMLEEDAQVHPPTGKRGDTEIAFTVDGVRVPLSYLSEGYRTIVATTVDVMREMLRYWPDLESAQGVVLIDEVETHLHPRWKMRIVRLLRQAMPRVQFLMTTHDPLCLRGLDDGEVTVVYRDADARITTVDDLPSVTGLSVQQLLTSEYFGLFTTEDPRVEAQLATYVALANKDDRTDDEEQELEVQRDLAMKRLVPGALPAHRVAYEAINSTLRKQGEEARYKRADLNREAMAKAIDLFTATRTESEAQ